MLHLWIQFRCSHINQVSLGFIWVRSKVCTIVIMFEDTSAIVSNAIDLASSLAAQRSDGGTARPCYGQALRRTLGHHCGLHQIGIARAHFDRWEGAGGLC